MTNKQEHTPADQMAKKVFGDGVTIYDDSQKAKEEAQDEIRD